MRIFNLFMIPLREIRFTAFVTDNSNQLALKCINKTSHTVVGLDVVGRLVVNPFYVKLTEEQVQISLRRTFMYFPRFFIPPPPLLKSSLKITFDGQMVTFYYRKHPNTSLFFLARVSFYMLFVTFVFIIMK